MRDIRFRARKATGEWAYFTLDQVLRHDHAVPTWVYEFPEIEKQLGTGKVDKNGVEIYEKDTLLIEGTTRGEVKYDDLRGAYVCRGYIVGNTWEPRLLEVIGNIHAYPELLGVRK